MSDTAGRMPVPVSKHEMTPDLARLDRAMFRTMAVRKALEKPDRRAASIILSGGPCEGEFELNHARYLRNALTNGAIMSEINRLEDGMDRAFTELAAGGNSERAMECLERRRMPSIAILARPQLTPDPNEPEDILTKAIRPSTLDWFRGMTAVVWDHEDRETGEAAPMIPEDELDSHLVEPPMTLADVISTIEVHGDRVLEVRNGDGAMLYDGHGRFEIERRAEEGRARMPSP